MIPNYAEGQSPYNQKSQLIFSIAMRGHVVNSIKDTFSIQNTTTSFQYLGSTLQFSRRQNFWYSGNHDQHSTSNIRLERKKKFSLAGRKASIQAITGAIPIYSINHLSVPRKFWKLITSNNSYGNCLAWDRRNFITLSWGRVVLPMLDGGLATRDLDNLAKWHFSTQPSD